MKTISVKDAIRITLITLMSTITACKTEDFLMTTESQKAVGGSWEIVKAMRNGADLTERMSNKQFRLTFQNDSAGNVSAYRISSELPFVVSKNGSWSFDDPLYPFAISFSPDDGSVASTVPFLFPIVEGKRQISLSFSPGCEGNTYQYVLEKVAE